MSEFGQKFIATVREVAAEHPDYVYDPGRCAYIVDGKPGCLLGQALWRMGIISPALGRQSHNDEDIVGLLDTIGLNLAIDEKEMDWVASAQALQDSNESWGDAVRITDRDCPLS